MTTTETPETYLMSLPAGTTFVDRSGIVAMVRVADTYEITEDESAHALSADERLDYAAEILCTTLGLSIA